MQGSLDILQIPDNIGYWLVRADGGKYFDDFLQNNFIAISDNEITIDMIRSINDDSIAGVTIDHYKNLYKETFENWNPQQIAHAAGRTQRFMDEMKKGDIVLVPSRRSTHFLIGLITSNPYELKPEDIQSETEVHYFVTPYLKRRDIYWIKLVHRKEISEKLYWILSAHQTIFDLSEEKDYINQLLAPIYIQNNLCHCNLKISKSEGLDTDEWFYFYSAIREVSKEAKEKVIVKSNVQSPGIVEIITAIIDSPVAVSVLGIMSGLVLTETKYGKYSVKGIVPYFLDRKSEKEKKLHENKKLEIENLRAEKEIELLEQEIKAKQIENIKKELEVVKLREQLQISSFDPGKVISIQTQMDSEDVVDEDKSEQR